MEKSKKIKGIYLKADTVNGVYEIDYSDITESDEISSPKVFLSSLKDLNVNESVIAFFDGNAEEIFDEIEKTYGIK
jgi:hypothetical protein